MDYFRVEKVFSPGTKNGWQAVRGNKKIGSKYFAEFPFHYLSWLNFK